MNLDDETNDEEEEELSKDEEKSNDEDDYFIYEPPKRESLASQKIAEVSETKSLQSKNSVKESPKNAQNQPEPKLIDSIEKISIKSSKELEEHTEIQTNEGYLNIDDQKSLIFNLRDNPNKN